MPSPPSKILRQLRLSEQKEGLSQRQKPDRHHHKSTTGRRALLTGAVVKPPAHESKVVQTAIRPRKGNPEHLLIHTVCPHSPRSTSHVSLLWILHLASPRWSCFLWTRIFRHDRCFQDPRPRRPCSADRQSGSQLWHHCAEHPKVLLEPIFALFGSWKIWSRHTARTDRSFAPTLSYCTAHIVGLSCY